MPAVGINELTVKVFTVQGLVLVPEDVDVDRAVVSEVLPSGIDPIANDPGPPGMVLCVFHVCRGRLAQRQGLLLWLVFLVAANRARDDSEKGSSDEQLPQWYSHSHSLVFDRCG